MLVANFRECKCTSCLCMEVIQKNRRRFVTAWLCTPCNHWNYEEPWKIHKEAGTLNATKWPSYTNGSHQWSSTLEGQREQAKFSVPPVFFVYLQDVWVSIISRVYGTISYWWVMLSKYLSWRPLCQYIMVFVVCWMYFQCEGVVMGLASLGSQGH